MSETVKKIKSNRDVIVLNYFTTVDASTKEIYNASKLNSNTESSAGNQSNKIWDLIQKKGVEAYAIKGKANEAIELLDVVDGSYCRRFALGNDYKFIPEDEIKNVVKGKLFTSRVVAPFPLRSKAVKNFINQAVSYSGDSAYSNVFQTIDKKVDYYADVTIKRTIDTLDTLSVKNNPLSNFPEQEANTGVVSGTLVARQKVLDENGENVLIPLSNVPIIIFNPSEEFPNYASQDTSGNRISLNILQNSIPSDYADISSYVLDVGEDNAKQTLGEDKVGLRYSGMKPILKSVETIFSPEQYKYSTITNDKGEFILQNVPVGNQVIMFDVDLLKQGMTKSEVALNFYPYSVGEDINIDSIPHFYFRQIPVGVGPSWGDFNTGYTEVNITAALDMRKWSTFFIPPVSVNGNNLEELAAGGNFVPLTILARDMTKEGYPLTTEIVEVDDVFSRVQSQRIEWFGEFKFTKPKITFTKNQYQVFKLPANLYDPNGYASRDSRRSKLSPQKGLWLSSYQMKMFYDSTPNSYKATGFVRAGYGVSQTTSSHFDLNRGTGSTRADATGKSPGSSLNTFPYERPWSINYPKKYSIPSYPRVVNEQKNYANQIEPRFLDGDLAGWNWGQPGATGYGLMIPLEFGNPIYNKFAQTVSEKGVYRYEANVAWNEQYSNGFIKKYHSGLFPGRTFNVENGEEYQRLEAGYGYFMRPEGWGRINHQPWGDIMVTSDIMPNLDPKSTNFIPLSYYGGILRQGENLTIKMDSVVVPSWLSEGCIDIYRLADEGPQNLSPRLPPLRPKYGKLEIDNVLRNNQKTSSQELKLKFGNEKDEMINSTGSIVEIRNNGAIKASINISGNKQQVDPGESVSDIILPSSSIELSTNTNFNFVDNFYETCNYTLTFKNSEIKNSGEVVYGWNDLVFNGGPSNEMPTKYLVTTIIDCDGNVRLDDEGKKDKCKNDFSKDGNYGVNGLVFERTRSDRVEISFEDAPVEIHCSDGGFGIRKFSPFS